MHVNSIVLPNMKDVPKLSLKELPEMEGVGDCYTVDEATNKLTLRFCKDATMANLPAMTPGTCVRA